MNVADWWKYSRDEHVEESLTAKLVISEACCKGPEKGRPELDDGPDKLLARRQRPGLGLGIVNPKGLNVLFVGDDGANEGKVESDEDGSGGTSGGCEACQHRHKQRAHEQTHLQKQTGGTSSSTRTVPSKTTAGRC
jgi:hypothetical protein